MKVKKGKGRTSAGLPRPYAFNHYFSCPYDFTVQSVFALATAITAEFGPFPNEEAVLTNNQVVSLLAIEYVKADVMGRILIYAMVGRRAYEKALNSEAMQALLAAKTVRLPE